MSSSNEKAPLVGAPEQSPIYREKTQTKTFKYILFGFVGVVILNLLISVIIVSVMAALHNGLFALLLVSLLSFAQVEFFLLFFIRRDYLPKKHYWVVFVVGVFVIIEAISTDIIVLSLEPSNP
ncbi:uncharacterized protein LOC135332491 [Halichondria panicea]|uniref:uncharacterized protein LOC135332491 n=1 Tax=Halichondria panicea TaxID=6063 RepID=UPI00312BA8FC